MSDFERRTWDRERADRATPLCSRCGDLFCNGRHAEAPDAGLAGLSMSDLYEFNKLYAGRDPEDLVEGLAEDLRLVREEIVTREMRVFESEATS